MPNISRTQLLSGDFRGERVVLRPPWSVDEAQFVELCTSCGECIGVCPTSILQKGRGGYPIVDFQKGECEFCAKCVEKCETGALKRLESGTNTLPWQLKAVIGESCLAYQGVICRSCGEQCESRAIFFQLSIGHAPRPEINPASCNGCGACYASCPTNAISINPKLGMKVPD